MNACFRILVLALPIVLLSSAGKAEQFLSGRLIVAGEHMMDPRFQEAVILILEHDREGALGVVLNQVIGTGPLGKLLAGFGIKPEDVDEAALSQDIELRQGGPVDPNRVIAVHSSDYHDDSSQDVGGGVAWTRDPTVLEAAAAGNGPDNLLIFIAYAGWGSGQLENEIERGDWLDANAGAATVFQVPTEDLYDTVKGNAGLSL